MSDTLSGTTHPDDNHDRPWWGLPCTVTPCFGARLVQEGNQLHYLADRAGIRGRFSDADAYHLDQAFPLLMKQLELMLTSGELNPRHQHTVTLYARGLTCKADTAHITETDNAWLFSLSHQTNDTGESEWIHFTGSGYLLRTDAWSYPVLRLKRLGLSKTFRRLVVTLIQRYGVSLIHLDASAECLPDLPTFGW
ncbi:DUF5983 family protein [Escherichia coli]|uniref:DUF5983 family protein n=30 Tax=Escherichia coli TaxID=562 RepID=UPI002023C172|nr:DUF5983 family protein [Escherichia coli]